MKVGQWIKIISMEGEPQYNGKVGRIEDIDSKGQLSGTWGGLRVQPERDSIKILTDAEVAEMQKAEDDRRTAYAAPHVDLEPVFVKFNFTYKPSRLQRLNGAQDKSIVGKIEFYPNGCEDNANKYKHDMRCLIGLPDNEVQHVANLINQKLKFKCCWSCNIVPCDLRKDWNECINAIYEAVEKLNGNYQATL